MQVAFTATYSCNANCSSCVLPAAASERLSQEEADDLMAWMRNALGTKVTNIKVKRKDIKNLMMCFCAMTKTFIVWPLAHSSSGHPSSNDHRAGNGCGASLPPHPAVGSHCWGESSDPAAHAGDQRWVRFGLLGWGEGFFIWCIWNLCNWVLSSCYRHDLIKKLHALKDTNAELAGLLLEQVRGIKQHICGYSQSSRLS